MLCCAAPNGLFDYAGTFGHLGTQDFDKTMFLAQSYLSTLMVAPPVLIAVITQSMYRWTGLLVVLVIIILGSWWVRGSDKPVTPATLRWSLVIWVIQAIVPVSLHFALRLPDNSEKVLLLVAGSVLFALVLLTFYVFAPDLRKQQTADRPDREPAL